MSNIFGAARSLPDIGLSQKPYLHYQVTLNKIRVTLHNGRNWDASRDNRVLLKQACAKLIGENMKMYSGNPTRLSAVLYISYSDMVAIWPYCKKWSYLAFRTFFKSRIRNSKFYFNYLKILFYYKIWLFQNLAFLNLLLTKFGRLNFWTRQPCSQGQN